MKRSPNKNDKLEKLLSKVGDMYFKRCIHTVLRELHVQEGDKILDAGCGEGFYELILSELYNCKIIGVDNDPLIIESARNWLKSNPRILFETRSICSLPYKSNTFDKIICTEVLEHVTNDLAALKELHRVLKPNGKIVITVPNENFPFLWDPLNKVRGILGLGHFNSKNIYLGGVWSYNHKRLYSLESLKTAIDIAGFKIADAGLITKYGLPFNLLLLNIGKQFYTRLSHNNSLRYTMEKFEWESPHAQKSDSLAQMMINLIFKAIKMVDKYNDGILRENSSSLGIFISATK